MSTLGKNESTEDNTNSQKNKPVLIIHAQALLDRKHSIKIGHGSVLHPYCRIIATNGPIHIGSYCIIHENVHIENILEDSTLVDSSDKQNKSTKEKPILFINDYTILHPNSRIFSKSIGTLTQIGASVYVGKNTIIEDKCIINPNTQVSDGDVLVQNTVVFGSANNHNTRIIDEKREKESIIKLSRWYQKNIKS